ncbi:MAG: hypothetical protein M3Z13_03570 [Candidatus Dormibacteraeota bacterium]|nr:hypothetical protein [Candidatus Dormibacteraeota bacterium]
MPGAELFAGEDQDTNHPDDARHWAEVYASLLRTLPAQMKTTSVEAHLRARLEYWEARYLELGEKSAELISPYNQNRPPRVRRARRPAAPESVSATPAELAR